MSDITTQALAAELRKMSDNAYCAYIEQMRRDLCLGSEHKIKHGKFGQDNLDAFMRAAEWLGRHKAMHEASVLVSQRTERPAMTDPELIEHMHARGWNVGTIDVPMIREACKALAAEQNPWRQAVDDALIAHALDCSGPEDDPKEKVKELLEWAVTIATDPRVSETAAREQEASATGAEPAGWKLVPAKATPEMERAADAYAIESAHRPKGFWWWGRLYEAMLAATPTTSTTGAQFPRRIVALLQDVAEGPFEDGNGECLMEDAKKALSWLATSLTRKDDLTDGAVFHLASRIANLINRHDGKADTLMPELRSLVQVLAATGKEPCIPKFGARDTQCSMGTPGCVVVHEATPVDVEQMLRDCVPGGNSCDPQAICDDIRNWFANGEKNV